MKTGDRHKRSEVGWVGVIKNPNSPKNFYLAIDEEGDARDTAWLYNAYRFSSPHDVMSQFDDLRRARYGLRSSTCTPKFMLKTTEITLFDSFEDAQGENGPENE